jgi:integrase
MPYVALPGFFTALRRKPSFGQLALELLILTGVRSQEVRLATWAEFDLETRLWMIPAEHMKRGKTKPSTRLLDGCQAVRPKQRRV